MLDHYIVLALRVFNRNRFYFIINIIGLGLGIACAIMIFTFVMYELSYDQFHKNKERIFRLTTYFKDQAQEEAHATTFPNLLPEFLDLFPDIETGVRLFDRSVLGSKDFIGIRGDIFINQKVYYADSSFFRVFTFVLIHGNPSDALKGPQNAVLTRASAMRYFGKEDVIGEIFMLNNSQEFKVAAVMEDIPAHSHFHFDVLLSMDSHPWVKEANWNGMIFPTYILLKEGIKPGDLTVKIDAFLKEKFPDQGENTYTARLPLQPLTEIHLHSNLKFELEPNNDIRYVYIFITVAFFLVFLACINYINLETSRSVNRAREVGLRKVFGAFKSNLVLQFTMESVVTVFLAFAASFLFIELFRLSFNNLSGIEFSFLDFFNNNKLFYYLAAVILTGIVSGLYPSFVLSSMKPESILRKSISGSSDGNMLRKLLVIFQFTIAMILVIGTLIISRQLNYIRNKNLGINKDQVIAVMLSTGDQRAGRERLKEELLKYHSIESATAVSQIPININFMEGISIENNTSEMSYSFYCLETDGDFFNTMGVDVIHGRPFNSVYSPENPEYVLNQSALQLLGWTPAEALGKRIMVRHGDMKMGPVVGIISDFHFSSMHSPIEPLVLWQFPRNFEFLLLSISGKDIPGTISYLEKRWKELTGLPVDYKFVSQEFDNLYRLEQRSGKLFSIFSFVILFIACIGLMGLSSFMAVKRTKEVGIRKVLGSSSTGILTLFIKDNLKAVIIAALIAVPVGYFLMQHWLDGFVFRITIGPGSFLIAMIIVVFISIMTVTFFAIRAANINPSDTLRYE